MPNNLLKMSEFSFKRFCVSNECSAMKVGTDGVLLGALLTLTGRERSILDAGTGTGTIALMIAQRLENQPDVHILGIDIDPPSAQEAQDNFQRSPWSEALTSQCVPLGQCEGTFDLIVSNPPYYDSSLKNPDGRKCTARHTAAPEQESWSGAPMSYRTLMDFAREHLTSEGRLALILPSDQEKELCSYGRMCGLRLLRLVRVSTTERKAPSRIVAEFGRGEGAAIEESIVIQRDGAYSEEYSALMRDFYLWA